MMRLAAATALALLAACGGQPLRFDLPETEVTQKIPVSVGSVEVVDVSLPLYADQEVIFFEDETSALVSDDSLLWADDPQRSFTEGLALQLAALTNARVAAEPWPFYDRADVRVDVRFSRALPGRDGLYRIAGQYFVASTEGTAQERARRFELAAPFQTLSAPSIAAAKAAVIAELATLIARDGL
ncbi:hypothetical protein SAMN04488020_102460 [Palleronia marisminoris]|uniref:ABC-type transport auxiliary lipoprotein component domain-containing protein n=1 Tax=Palleronia marisminoris TaxID=315423 RepID=A0A1Y5RVK5_9RHOB|nr:ABC-type transport auxiliary lipoprotein family protein [Palleronia marisminoris]SFG52963.1 hypothetical protein SAMN04488020_102460 [Palleronia marisminoris]SLN23820.1 hypothetical protein PAM7066_00821 [Palleronia marisminoris]